MNLKMNNKQNNILQDLINDRFKNIYIYILHKF